MSRNLSKKDILTYIMKKIELNTSKLDSVKVKDSYDGGYYIAAADMAAEIHHHIRTRLINNVKTGDDYD